MPITKITSNVLAANAAQDNLNAGSSITLSKTVTINSSAVINGNFTVDGNVLFVDGVNNRVGIGTATPTSTLDVAGTTRTQGINSLGSIQVGGGNSYTFDSRGLFSASSDGVFLFRNWALTDFNRIQFGGTTNSFPSIKRSGTELHIRLADDSGFAPLQTSNITASGNISATGNTTISGNLTVDTNTLFVNSVNNRVGVGTTTPQVGLHLAASGTEGRIRIQSLNDNPVLEFQSTAGISYLFTNSSDWHMRTDNVTKHVKLQSGSTNNGYVQIGGRLQPFGPTPLSQLTITANTNDSNFGLLDVQDYNSTSRLYVRFDGNVGIGTTTPSEKLTVSGNISASGTVNGSNLVYTSGDQTVAGVKTFSNNIVGNGTDNRLPNQLLDNVDDIVTRQLGDSRYSTHNRIIRTDTLGNKSVFEQFIDFEDQYDADIFVPNAFGAINYSVSPPVFGDTWNTSTAGVTAFQGQDAHTHNGILLIRGHTTSNNCFYIGIRRPTSPDVLSNSIREFTCRVFVRSLDFTTQGFFKIGPIQKGGTGGGDSTLTGGLMFNPYIHPTNLVVACNKTGVASPFLFTTNPANVDFVDTGINFVNLLDRWVNITYIIDETDTLNRRLKIIVVREGVTLASLNYNISVDLASITRNFNLYSIGASREIGIQYGKFTYTTRSEIFIDYLYSKYSGTSTAPSNWNSLRF